VSRSRLRLPNVPSRELGLVIVLVLIAAVVAPQSSAFLSADNLKAILLSVTLIGIVAMGQMLVVLTRNIDLSVGSAVAVAGYITADWLAGDPSRSLVIAFLLGMGVGLVLGIVNGLLVAVLRIPAIVATLGTLSIYRGIAVTIAGGKQVSAAQLPDAFLNIGTSTFLGLPTLGAVAIALTILFALGLRWTRTGRRLYMLGSNPESAALAGLPVRRLTIGVYAVCGLLSGLAGVLWSARFGSIEGTAASGYELTTISAVVIGGVSIFGGSGGMVGALLGALMLGTVDNAFQLLKIDPFWLNTVTGLSILGAVTLYTLMDRRATARRVVHRRKRVEGSSGPAPLPARAGGGG
jgi:rhamnose transport system permease protein